MRFLVSAIAWLCLVSPSFAQNTFNWSAPITDFNWESVTPVLDDMNAPYVFHTTDDGKNYLEIQGGVMPIYVQQWACGESVCVGLVLYTVLNPAGRTLADVNNLNGEYYFLKSQLADGKLILSRYLTADHGIAKGNVVVNLQVLNSLTGTISGQTGANQVSYDAAPDSEIHEKVANILGSMAEEMPLVEGHAESGVWLSAE